MKTLIEKFTETVRLTATNFCLTDGLNRDGIDSISFTQHKRGLARYIYGKSYCLGGLTKSSNPKLYAIATDEIVYIINLESFGLDAVKDKEKLPMNTITLEDHRRTWIKRQETLLDGYMLDLRANQQGVEISESQLKKCKDLSRHYLLYKELPEDKLLNPLGFFATYKDCENHLCGYIDLEKETIKRLEDTSSVLCFKIICDILIQMCMKAHIGVEPWEMALSGALKKEMRSVEVFLESGGKTVKSYMPVLFLLEKLDKKEDFDILDFLSAPKGKDRFSKLPLTDINGLSVIDGLSCKDIVKVSYRGKTIYEKPEERCRCWTRG